MNWERNAVTHNPRLAGQVLRYHTWPTIQKQTVGEHTWQVMRIFVELFGNSGKNHSDLYHILFHDAGEIVTGDLPFPLKRNNPELKKIMDALEDVAISEMNIQTETIPAWLAWRFKVCDLLEMLEFGLQEQQMGNQLAQPIISGTASAVRAMCDSPSCDTAIGDIPRIKTKLMSTISRWTGERGHVV